MEQEILSFLTTPYHNNPCNVLAENRVISHNTLSQKNHQQLSEKSCHFSQQFMKRLSIKARLSSQHPITKIYEQLSAT